MMDWYQQVNESEGFDWDFGNRTKNVQKHGVSLQEAERVFKNRPLILLYDTKHSISEMRIWALGKTNEGKLLHVSFTMRKKLIRIISVRPMHSKERKIYEAKTKH